MKIEFKDFQFSSVDLTPYHAKGLWLKVGREVGRGTRGSVFEDVGRGDAWGREIGDA